MLWSLLHAYRLEVLWSFLGQALIVATQMADPFVVKWLVDYFQDPEALIIQGLWPAFLYVVSNTVRRQVGDQVPYYQSQVGKMQASGCY